MTKQQPGLLDEAETMPRPFHRLDGSTRWVHMMDASGASPRHAEVADAHIVELAYRGQELGMLLVVPKAVAGLGAQEADLTAEELERWVGALEARPIDLMVPRFVIRSRLHAGEALRAMGMRRAFTLGEADFSAMTSLPLALEQALQASFVAVDETGTEAAAAGALMAGGYGPGPERPSVVADHPFLFFVRHRATGSILFMGRVLDPCADEPTRCPDGPRAAPVEPRSPAPPPELDEDEVES